MAKKNPCAGCALFQKGECLLTGCSQWMLELTCARFGNNIYAASAKKCHVCGDPNCLYANASLQVQELCHSYSLTDFNHEKKEPRDIEEEKISLAKKKYLSWDANLTKDDKVNLFTVWMQ